MTRKPRGRKNALRLARGGAPVEPVPRLSRATTSKLESGMPVRSACA